METNYIYNYLFLLTYFMKYVSFNYALTLMSFPFTRYGTLTGTVSFVSNDAVPDEKRGLIFHARVKLDTAKLRVDERDVTLTPGMAVSAEISTGRRRVIEFFLDVEHRQRAVQQSRRFDLDIGGGFKYAIKQA